MISKDLSNQMLADGKAFAFNLLEKYMRHVKQCEGTDFVDQIGVASISGVRFNLNEEHVLRSISEEINR